MAQRTQFRRVLPVLQTAIALFVGGWGVWIRVSILNHPFFGGTLWDSTARFHVWPWPLKFATVLNFPAVLAGGLFAIPFSPVWASYVLTLPFVGLLWYLIGSWLDLRQCKDATGKTARRQWVAIFLFMVTCAAAASLPTSVGGYASYVPLGILIWLIVAIAIGPTVVKSRYHK